MRRILVFGPAYLDRVLRVDRPLLDEGVIDGSYEGKLVSASDSWTIRDPRGGTIFIVNEAGHEGENRTVELARSLSAKESAWTRSVRLISDTEDLGGMGAGYAKAFGGELISALGVMKTGELDPFGAKIAALLSQHRISHRPILVPEQQTDWSLIVSSGAFADKLAIGFRGCHANVSSLPSMNITQAYDLVCVAGLPNRLVEQALSLPTSVRFFAPAMRNMKDRDPPLSALAGRFDILSCNRSEWEALPDREAVASQTPIVVVTDGPEGCRILYFDDQKNRLEASYPAFPRDAPPRDTNRAGEAFASTFVTTLLDSGWQPGPAASSLVRLAAELASASAALELDREDFGFPSAAEIRQAVCEGRVRRRE